MTVLAGAYAPLLLLALWPQNVAASNSVCDSVDCGVGFCIDRETTEGYLCVCMDGYEGKYCEKRFSRIRLSKRRDVGNPCDANPCANGGTCVSATGEMDGEPPEGEAPIGEGEAGTDGEVARNEMENAAGTGEAPVDVGESLLEMTGESQLKSDCEGN